MGVPDGIAGVRATLSKMAGVVRNYKCDAGIHEFVRRLTAGCPPQNVKGAARLYVACLQQFVRDAIRYVQDIEGVETLQTPDYTLSIGCGDCDDKSMLLCTLLASIGYPVMFFAIGVNGGDIEHVLAGVKLGTRQVPLETIIPAGQDGCEVGDMPPGTTLVLPWNI